MSAARDKGTRAETAVVRALNELGFPYAERRALRGRHDRGDITGTPGICWEVKSYADLARAIREGLQEAEKAALPGELPVAVARRRNKPAEDWYCILPLRRLCGLLQELDGLVEPADY